MEIRRRAGAGAIVTELKIEIICCAASVLMVTLDDEVRLGSLFCRNCAREARGMRVWYAELMALTNSFAIMA